MDGVVLEPPGVEANKSGQLYALPFCHCIFRRQDDPEGASVLNMARYFMYIVPKMLQNKGCLNTYSV
jgi:hypothetical protein